MTTTKVLIATPSRWSVTKPAGALAPDAMNTHPSVSGDDLQVVAVRHQAHP